MSGRISTLANSTKRRFSRVTTTPNALNAGMNQEFVDTRRRLNDISTAIKRLSKSVENTRQTWLFVARQQRDFSRAFSSSFPQTGTVQQYAVDVEKRLENVQRDIVKNDSNEAPHQQILDVMEKYTEILQSIKQQYKEVELLYTEKMRYQRKVDKLEKKDLKHRKNSDKLVRNVEKLTSAQEDLDSKMDAILERMRNAFQKHESVLQCAHHAFWMANNTHMNTIDQATNDIRTESFNVHQILMDLNLSEKEQLEPIPTPNLLAQDENAAANENLPITNGEDEQVNENETVANKESEAAEGEDESHSTANETAVPVGSSVSSVVESEVEKLEKKIESQIPDVPTMKPSSPVTHKLEHPNAKIAV